MRVERCSVFDIDSISPYISLIYLHLLFYNKLYIDIVHWMFMIKIDKNTSEEKREKTITHEYLKSCKQTE